MFQLAALIKIATDASARYALRKIATVGSARCVDHYRCCCRFTPLSLLLKVAPVLSRPLAFTLYPKKRAVEQIRPPPFIIYLSPSFSGNQNPASR
jgi:hypothetical protein